MKLLFLSFTALLIINLHGQHLQIGDHVPGFSLTVVGEHTQELSSEAMDGKAILLDFWATWCSPCISGMAHLDELQTTFADQLQVIAVSEERQDRLQRFVQRTDHDFLFARDSGVLRKFFPYQIIPHSVLIDPSGVVVAITSPENITTRIIEKALSGVPLDLPVKEDRQDFDPAYDYFQADSLTRNAFQLQPHKPNFPSFSKSYGSGPFKNRRFTAYNMTIDGLYRYAFQTTSLRQELAFEEALVDWENEANRYCLDIIVEDPASLFQSLKEQLATIFPIQARLEKRTKDVVVISTLAGEVLAPAGVPTEQYTGRGDGFSSTGATMANFCAYLESFGIFGYPVVDETGKSTAFSIDFSFDPENPESFKEAMKKYGLGYKKEPRDIEVLVLFLKE